MRGGAFFVIGITDEEFGLFDHMLAVNSISYKDRAFHLESTFINGATFFQCQHFY